ncbi:MAG: hypothetical protein WCH39_14145 [Schlesneria sp.]
MSIQIPCPNCGRELKLPDRTLLGRKGKCPKCAHTFILEEPPVVALELANPEPAASVTKFPSKENSPPAFFEINQPIKSSQATPKENVAPGIGISPVLADLDQVVKPKGTAERLKEQQRKSARQRNIGLAITALAAALIGGFVFFGPKSVDKTTVTKTEEKTDGTDPAIDGEPDQTPSTGFANPRSPTQGKPIQLQFIPFGTQVVLNLHPAELWKPGSLGEEIRYCVPPLAKLVETTLNDLFQRKPEQVEELLICLLPGIRGSLPDIAAVAHMVDEQKQSQLIEQFGQYLEVDGQSVYTKGYRAYMIVNGKTLVACPKSQIQEMVEAIKKRHPVEQIDPLLPMTDRDRHITAIFTPLTLGLQETWFPENVRPFVKNSLEWLGEEVETVSWSFHLKDEQFYSEILLRGKGSSGKNSAKKLEQDFKTKLAQLAESLLPQIEQMNPREQGKRMVIGRVPAMVEVFSLATIVNHGPQYVQLITPLPDRAAPNLALGTLLAWDESTRTDFSKAKAKPPAPDGPSVPELIADRLKMKIDVDFRRTPLNEAFAFIGGEIKTPFEIDGDALKLGGFTKNIAQVFKMDGAKVQDIILMIFKESKGIDPKPEKTLVIIVDESNKNVVVTTLATANDKGLKPFDLSK